VGGVGQEALQQAGGDVTLDIVDDLGHAIDDRSMQFALERLRYTVPKHYFDEALSGSTPKGMISSKCCNPAERVTGGRTAIKANLRFLRLVVLRPVVVIVPFIVKITVRRQIGFVVEEFFVVNAIQIFNHVDHTPTKKPAPESTSV
jgi:hypothetical protein